VTAAIASAQDRARLWPRLLDAYPGYARYEERTAGLRDIPIVLLTPRRRED